MASLSREVHEVLEEEYVSMYGPLDAVSPRYVGIDGSEDEKIEKNQILDVSWAMKILRDCDMPHESRRKGEIADMLNELVSKGIPESIEKSPALTDIGRILIQQSRELFESGTFPPDRQAELNRRILDDAFCGAVKPLRDVRLANVYDALHKRAKADPADRRAALCISGGGIRSATFALGVIQGLASAKILDKFDYLSTVSGGGYIGGWLSSWARRHPHGISGVQEDLALADTAVGGGRPAKNPGAKVDETKKRAEKMDPEPRPLRHLRDYSNYLSPRIGLLSGDSWTMGALYFRNLLLNLLVLVPLIAAVLALPRLFAYASRAADTSHFLWPWATAGLIAFAFGYIGWRRPIDGAPTPRDSDGRFFTFCILPLVGAATMLALRWAELAGTPDWRAEMRFELGLIVVAMTIVPLIFYYSRYIPAYRKTWRMTNDDARRVHFFWKPVAEAGGAVVGISVAALLFALLAYKVFDAPMQPVGDLIAKATRAPALRAGLSMTPWSALYTCLAVPAGLLVFFIQATLFVGISSRCNEDHDREWWGRAGGWLLVAAAAWAVLSAITLFGPIAIYNAPVLLGSIGGLSGIASALLGFSAKTPANKKQKDDAGPAAKAGNVGLGIAVPLFVVFFLALISAGTTWLVQEVRPLIDVNTDPIDWSRYERDAQFESKGKRTLGEKAVKIEEETAAAPHLEMSAVRALQHLRTVQNTSKWELVAILFAALMAVLQSACVGVNRFSMHALYRNRLIRAYLGASRYTRNPNPFTGFDEKDNLPMSDLRPELLWASNLNNAQAFFDALKDGKRTTHTGLVTKSLERRKLAQHLWARFSDKTRKHLERVSGKAIDAVIQNLNAVFADEDEKELLERVVNLPDDFWTTPVEGKVPYSPLVRNRAVFDYYFDDVITPMARPKDLEKTETAVATNNATIRDTGVGPNNRAPLHVVNMALNLVAGDKLAWQQRMAESFTVSPYQSGSLFLGYRDSCDYGGGISLGTAVTISGAAASPNMGYHSSPALAFLLTLFNIRLGWWLGNPGPVGEKVYRNEHPHTNLEPIVNEAIGRTNDTYEWVYLSDGGHFENLGLYEMVLRRCHTIVLSDAAADPGFAFEDLGNAIRKIRTDLGVPIDIEEMFMFPRGNAAILPEGRYVATATIRYKAVDGEQAENGLLVYLKPGCYNDPYFPRDVFNYASQSAEFPHESTADQFFSESQFESYRALGRHAVNEICGNYPDRTTPRPRVPIAKTFEHVGAFAEFVEQKARREHGTPPEQVIATAIKEATRRPLLRR